MLKEPLLSQLQAHQALDSTEAAHQARLCAFVAQAPEPFSRGTREGHVTGSAVALDSTGEKLLLIWHVKLQRWLQPGGHCEPELDADVAATALRELLEETETDPDDWTLAKQAPLDLDVHTIPARGDEPEHSHHDIRYLFVARPGLQPSLGKWVTLTELAALPDPSLSRLAQKANSSAKLLFKPVN